MGASNAGDNPPLPNQVKDTLPLESTILTQTTTSQETPIVVENPPSWNRFLTILFLILGVFFTIFAFLPTSIGGPPSFFLAMMCLFVSLFFETSLLQQWFPSRKMNVAEIDKTKDVVLTVENPVILEEPKSKKPYSLWASILVVFSFFSTWIGFEDGESICCIFGFASSIVCLILILLDLQLSRAYKSKNGISTIPEDFSLVITTLLLLLLVGMGILAYFLITSDFS